MKPPLTPAPKLQFFRVSGAHTDWGLSSSLPGQRSPTILLSAGTQSPLVSLGGGAGGP